MSDIDLTEAVEAAAQVLYADEDYTGIGAAWDDPSTPREHYHDDARRILAAAAPLIEAQALRNWANDVEARYPAGVFIPPTADWLAEVHSFCAMRGHTLDAISAHVMRHAAGLARYAATSIARGAS